MSKASGRCPRGGSSSSIVDAGVRFTVRLTPRAAADQLVGVAGGTLVVRVTAAPTDGAANASLVRLLAAALRIAPSRIRIVSGARARLKTLAVDGSVADAVTARWPGLRRGSP